MSIKEKVQVNTHYTRSINLERDASSVSVIESYIPTTRALKLFNRMSERMVPKDAPRAWSLVGPYGSGKSSASIFLSQLLADPKTRSSKAAMLNLGNYDEALQKNIKKHVAKSKGYLNILVTGSPESMSKSILKSIEKTLQGLEQGEVQLTLLNEVTRVLGKATLPSNAVLQVIKHLQKNIHSLGYKGIFFVIDELGKFLEFEARHYGANDIFVLQSLAEHAYKGSEANLFLVVLLHQSFEQYAKTLGDNLKNEWAKVQGRFEEVPFLESPEQTLRVVSAAFEYSMTDEETKTLSEKYDEITDTLYQNAALPSSMEREGMSALLSHCYPLHPVSAILLPVLCQTVAQNERTLFSYLGSSEECGLQNLLEKFTSTEDFIYPHHIYEYFLTNMPTVVSDFRTHRRWAEVVTAVDRLGDAPEDQIDLLKTIGLLNILGAKGGFKASEAILTLCSNNREQTKKNLTELQNKSIITYRQFNAEYRVWQGSDFDLETALREEIAEIGEFLLTDELNRAEILQPIVARRYTIENGALRYFVPAFVDRETYNKIPQIDEEPRIIFFLAHNQKDQEFFKETVSLYYQGTDLLGVCQQGKQLESATKEVLALRRILTNTAQLSGDPIAKKEVIERLNNSEQDVMTLIQRVIGQPQESQWYFAQKQYSVETQRGFQWVLSTVLEAIYNKAPTLNSELINRDRLSAQVNGARTRLLQAMLLNPKDKPDLGIEKFPPEKSIYRSILLKTGIHDAQTHKFVAPQEGTALYPAWERIEEFLDSTQKQPKSFVQLNKELNAAPYGIKVGILPVLYMAVYLVNKNELAVYENNQYCPRFTEEMVNRFIKRPDEFYVQRFKITGVRSEIFNEYSKIIKTGKTKTVVNLVKPLAEFIATLPEYTLKTKSEDLSEKTRKVREAFKYAMSPERLMFEDLPKALGFEVNTSKDEALDGLSDALVASLKELKSAYSKMINRQVRLLKAAFRVNEDASLAELRAVFQKRYFGLDEYTVDVDGLKPFIKRLTKEVDNDEAWLENLLMFLSQKPTAKWLDSDCSEIDVKIGQYAKRILDLEMIALEYEHQEGQDHEDYEVILLKTLKKGNPSNEEVVLIDKKKMSEVEALKNKLLASLNDADSEIRISAVAKLVNELLSVKQK